MDLPLGYPRQLCLRQYLLHTTWKTASALLSRSSPRSGSLHYRTNRRSSLPSFHLDLKPFPRSSRNFRSLRAGFPVQWWSIERLYSCRQSRTIESPHRWSSWSPPSWSWSRISATAAGGYCQGRFLWSECQTSEDWGCKEKSIYLGMVRYPIRTIWDP